MFIYDFCTEYFVTNWYINNNHGVVSEFEKEFPLEEDAAFFSTVIIDH